MGRSPTNRGRFKTPIHEIEVTHAMPVEGVTRLQLRHVLMMFR